MKAKDSILYTLGHSNHELEVFLGPLRQNGVEVVVDVRAQPYSAYAIQFNRDTLKASLKERGIRYLHMGDSLGGMLDEPSLVADGFLDYEKVARLPRFLQGIERVQAGVAKGYTLCLVCSEKDPAECHRGLLIARVLSENGLQVVHLTPDAPSETQRQLEERLVATYFPQANQMTLLGLPGTWEEKRVEAYRRQNRKIAPYRPKGGAS
ncbi:MAG TPA: DUF488 domain-containing protein [Thermotogota bacterium]|nr:DUF488 domain-containing protein [Thermotogota bacterium]